MTVDPVGSGTSPYAYSANRVALLIDPTGLWKKEPIHYRWTLLLANHTSIVANGRYWTFCNPERIAAGCRHLDD